MKNPEIGSASQSINLIWSILTNKINIGKDFLLYLMLFIPLSKKLQATVIIRFFYIKFMTTGVKHCRSRDSTLNRNGN